MNTNATRQFFLGAIVLVTAGIVVAQEKSAEATYPVRIIIEARPDAKFYQVEWLEQNNIGDQATASPETSRQEKITKTEIRRNLPVRFKYFRLRSAYRDGLFGAWGEIVEIQRPEKIAGNPETDPKKPDTKNSGYKPAQQDVFVQVIDQQGRIKWVLRGAAVPAERLASNNPLFYDVECLTEKNAPENTNGRKKYEGPIPFTRAGQYKMNLYAGDDAAAQPLQTWIFWVYTDTPRSYVKFYAPFLHGKGGFTVGGKTKIALMTHPSPVAVDKLEYRIFPEGQKAGAWIKYEDEIEVNSFAKDQYGFFNIEYQTTSVSGAIEPPQTRRMLIDAKGPVIEESPAAEGGTAQLMFKDENFPIVVRFYQGDVMVDDKYFKFWKANDVMQLPQTQGIEIRAIDLLGNETILKK